MAFVRAEILGMSGYRFGRLNFRETDGHRACRGVCQIKHENIKPIRTTKMVHSKTSLSNHAIITTASDEVFKESDIS